MGIDPWSGAPDSPLFGHLSPGAEKHVEGVQSELVSAKHEAAQANDQIVNLKKQVAGLTSELHQTCAALQSRVKEQPLNSRLGV